MVPRGSLTVHETQPIPDGSERSHVGALQSARVILPIVFDAIAPTSVLHLGCDCGGWLQACAELGIRDIAGVRAANLDTPVDLGRRFDLAISVEVAHDLAPQVARTLAASLVKHCDVVLFSAAIPGQSPTCTQNGQWPEYWAQLFAAHDFVPTDGLRARCWLETDVEPCYAQNSLIFVHQPRLREFPELAAHLVHDGSPLPLVHPRIFADALRRAASESVGQPETWISPPALDPPPSTAAATDTGLRRFVTVVYADELPGEADILRSYTRAFAPVPDATLVIYAPDREPRDVLGVLGGQLTSCGIEDEHGPHVSLLCVASDEGDPFLAKRANAVLSRRKPRTALSAIPHAGPGAATLIAALAAGVVPSPGRRGGLAAALIVRTIVAAGGPDLADNVDLIRYADGMGAPAPDDWAQLLAVNVRLADQLESLWERLDSASRDIVVSLLAYGVLGHPKVRLNVGPFARVQEMARALRDHIVQAHTADPGFLNWLLDEYDLRHLGFPIQLHSHPRLLINEFVLEQYRAPQPAEVAVRSGDVVIDGGGCWGETALHFAFLAGPAGRVHTFEFVPQNLVTMRRNLELNPELAARIEVHERALWTAPGEQVQYNPNAGGTRVETDGGATTAHAPTASIDALIAAAEIDRVDFLKLDVEGSELAVLEGAESAIRQYRPRLAISAYHRADDLVVLPGFIDGLGLGYRYAIGHFTMSTEETVLFAWCDSE